MYCPVTGISNELYVLNTATLEWSDASRSLEGTVPSPRSLSQLVSIGSKVFIFGGQYKYGAGGFLYPVVNYKD
jgi:hypothetical protein